MAFFSVSARYSACLVEHGCLKTVSKCLQPILFSRTHNTSTVKRFSLCANKTRGTPYLPNDFRNVSAVNSVARNALNRNQ